MKKFLLFLLVAIALIGLVTSANWVKRFYETEGETFTVLYSEKFIYEGWFDIKDPRSMMVASTPSSTNLYYFYVSKKDALPAGKKFTVSFGRIRSIDGEITLPANE